MNPKEGKFMKLEFAVSGVTPVCIAFENATAMEIAIFIK